MYPIMGLEFGGPLIRGAQGAFIKTLSKSGNAADLAE
jgi:hypothetical protein